MKKILTNSLTLGWLVSLPKDINTLGCWIAKKPPNDEGYVEVVADGKTYKLHRLSLCLSLKLDYYGDFQARHILGCDRRCFNPDHLASGSNSENQLDSVRHGTHFNSKKETCPFGHTYSTIVIKAGSRKGRTKRYCKLCARSNRMLLTRKRRDDRRKLGR